MAGFSRSTKRRAFQPRFIFRLTHFFLRNPSSSMRPLPALMFSPVSSSSLLLSELNASRLPDRFKDDCTQSTRYVSHNYCGHWVLVRVQTTVFYRSNALLIQQMLNKSNSWQLGKIIDTLLTIKFCSCKINDYIELTNLYETVGES